jgi:hypothetical protein
MFIKLSYYAVRMADDISEAVDEQQLEEAAIVLMRQKHHHSDGSGVVLQPIHEDALERRLIEGEQRQKEMTALPEGRQEEPVRQRKELPKQETWQPVEKKKQVVLAGCNCGQTLTAEFKDKDNPIGGGVAIKGYNAQGEMTVSYGVSGGGSETYSVQGDASKDYA